MTIGHAWDNIDITHKMCLNLLHDTKLALLERTRRIARMKTRRNGQ